MSNPTPYRVCFGYMERCESAFATWPEALAFARRKRAATANDTYNSVRIYNEDRMDGAEDSKCPYGLTEEEREEWEQ